MAMKRLGSCYRLHYSSCKKSFPHQLLFSLSHIRIMMLPRNRNVLCTETFPTVCEIGNVQHYIVQTLKTSSAHLCGIHHNIVVKIETIIQCNKLSTLILSYNYQLKLTNQI